MLKKNLVNASHVNAKETEKAIKGLIERGSPLWPTLGGLTVSRKGHASPLMDKGELYGSIQTMRTPEGSYFAGIPVDAVNSNGVSLVMIGTVHEYGHEGITPKEGNYLALPLNEEAAELQQQYGSARNIPGLIRVKKVLAFKDGAGIRPMFILKTSVSIPARPFISPSQRKVEKKAKARYELAAKYAQKGKVFTG